MQLEWVKSAENRWHRLEAVELQQPVFDFLEGVYIIWHAGNRAATICVGQGKLRDSLSALGSDPQITRFSLHGLFVTWATVERYDREGVEAYLTQTLEPKVRKRTSRQSPIPVNLPW